MRGTHELRYVCVKDYIAQHEATAALHTFRLTSIEGVLARPKITEVLPFYYVEWQLEMITESFISIAREYVAIIAYVECCRRRSPRSLRDRTLFPRLIIASRCRAALRVLRDQSERVSRTLPL